MTVEFIDSDFFKNWFKPHLEKGKESLEKSLTQIAISSVLNGESSDRLAQSMNANVGKLVGISSILQDLKSWIEEGEAACKKLENDKEDK